MIQYFSYGSNLHQAHLNRFCEKEGRPTIELRNKNPRRAILKDYKLDFNYYSNLMDGGAANLEPSTGEQVEGVVFEMTDEDMITLDLRERAPDYFYRILVDLTLIDGGGSLSHVVAYVACEDKKMSSILSSVMEQEGISERDFVIRSLPEMSAEGGARDMISAVEDLKITEPEADELNPRKKKLAVEFSLKKGCYATIVIKDMFAS